MKIARNNKTVQGKILKRIIDYMEFDRDCLKFNKSEYEIQKIYNKLGIYR